MKRPNFEKNLTERKIPVYVLLLTLVIGACITVSFGWAVRHVLIANYDINAHSRLGTFGETLLIVAKFPSLLKETHKEVMIGGPQVINMRESKEVVRFSDLDGFKKSGKIQEGALEDKGYLLLSSYDKIKGQSIVQLIRIIDQQILYEWVPDIDALGTLTNNEIIKSSFRMVHPLLLEDGGLVFKGSNFPLFKIGPSSSVEWYIDGIFHHSIELDAEGNIWVGARMRLSSYAGTYDFDDNSIVQLTPNGEVLFEKSVAKIFDENGYRHLWWIVFGLTSDPFHLNDVQPVLTDSEFWKKGDLLLSLRNLHTIVLYRPETDRIVWLKTGPWINQHDVDIISNHEISVFGNDVLFGRGVILNDHNNVYFYDFINDKVTKPFDEVMKSMEVRTKAEGLSEIITNGDVFIEETMHGRILRLSTKIAKWEFVRRVDENHLSLLSWSRYLTEEQVQAVLPKLQNSSYNQ